MLRVRTAVVSDLHLGLHAEADVARKPEVRAALVEAVGDSDRVVLLGDILELRELPLSDALELGRPLFEELGRALAGRRAFSSPAITTTRWPSRGCRGCVWTGSRCPPRVSGR